MAFLDVSRHPCAALGGQPLPLQLRALSAMAAVFSADAGAARALLPAAMAGVLQPLSWRPGRCLLGVIAVRYLEGDLGAYDELAVVLPVGHGAVPQWQALRNLLRKRFEAFIWQMPVTTARARDGGVRLAGFPKWVADLRRDDGAGRLRCALHEDGSDTPALALECRDAEGHGPARELSLLAHTLLEGVPVVSELRLRQERWREHPGGGARLVLGRGPLADALRALDIGERALWSQVVPQAQALLYGPRRLGG
ncbi:acetoacetate decarboxylase family protein [Azohydromonas aeria]|uniref:acetoacetate decarboxylase family protein n=1 Tax=Azohydromonas aeria TaxID=2590212 RepID=UPI0012FAB51D|nr:acetoacetate decarboxylase family protein [Azohydromonas aeria]